MELAALDTKPGKDKANIQLNIIAQYHSLISLLSSIISDSWSTGKVSVREQAAVKWIQARAKACAVHGARANEPARLSAAAAPAGHGCQMAIARF